MSLYVYDKFDIILDIQLQTISQCVKADIVDVFIS